MRIAFLAPECSPSWGGVGSYTYNLVSNLPEEVEIHIITIERDRKDSYEDLLSNRNVTIHKIIHVSKDESFFYNARFQIALFFKLKKLHERFDFDLIHSHSGHLPHYLSQFRAIAPMVITVHTESRGLKRSRESSKRKDRTEILNDLFSPIIEFGEKINFERAQKLLPISKFTLRQIEELYDVDVDDKSRIIYNGVDIDLFKPSNEQSGRHITICFAGRLYAVKGLDILLKAILELVKQDYKIKLLLAGRGEMNYVRRMLEGVPSHMYSILGMVDYERMPQVYNQSDIVVMPSMYEGCSGAILEALSCGRIVIASDAGGTPEIINSGQNGLLFKSGDSYELKQRLVDVLEETIDIPSLRRAARRTAIERFSWKDKGMEVYREYADTLRRISGEVHESELTAKRRLLSAEGH